MEFKEGKPINTSKSNSSGPASGSKIYGSASIPGAVIFDGGTETTADSGLRMALCPAAWNEQFLGKRSLLVVMGREMNALDCRCNATPSNFVLVFSERNELGKRILQTAVTFENIDRLRRKEKVSSGWRLKIIILR